MKAKTIDFTLRQCPKSGKWVRPLYQHKQVDKQGRLFLQWGCRDCTDKTSPYWTLDCMENHALIRVLKPWQRVRCMKKPQTIAGIPIIGTLSAATSIPALVVRERIKQDRYISMEVAV